jgi:hypothetical protein
MATVVKVEPRRHHDLSLTINVVGMDGWGLVLLNKIPFGMDGATTS